MQHETLLLPHVACVTPIRNTYLKTASVSLTRLVKHQGQIANIVMHRLCCLRVRLSLKVFAVAVTLFLCDCCCSWSKPRLCSTVMLCKNCINFRTENHWVNGSLQTARIHSTLDCQSQCQLSPALHGRRPQHCSFKTASQPAASRQRVIRSWSPASPQAAVSHDGVCSVECVEH